MLLGVGSIGRELLAQLAGRDAPVRVCGLVDRSGFLFDGGGFSIRRLEEVAARKRDGACLATQGGTEASAAQAFESFAEEELWRPVLVDATAADTGAVLERALTRGWDLVLANKIPLAADRESAERLEHAARLHRRRILHEATVGAGLPVLDTLRKLQESGDRVLHIEGCPSGTLGYVFGEISRGRAFSAALRDAVAKGYTEPDPRVDLSGLDVARKALILARRIGFAGDLRHVAVDSLVPAGLERVGVGDFLARAEELDAAWTRRAAEARLNGCVLRYRARATPTSVAVGLVEVPHTDPLGALQGTDNQFAFRTSRYDEQPLVIRGPGAGPAVTAAGVFNDLLRLAAEPALRM